jgi:hypothetical protein
MGDWVRVDIVLNAHKTHTVARVKLALQTRALVATLRVLLAIPQEVVTVCLAHLASI